jgi:hypothetical protein
MKGKGRIKIKYSRKPDSMASKNNKQKPKREGAFGTERKN